MTGRSDHLARRQSSSVRNLGLALVAFVALWFLGGQLATGAAGCFSNLSADATPPLEVGGRPQPAEPADDAPAAGTLRLKVQTHPGGSRPNPSD